MRSFIVFSLCLVGLIAVGAKAQPRPVSKAVAKASTDKVIWQASVKSQLPHSTKAAAWNDALSVAAHELYAHMQDHKPALEFVPAPEFIRERLKVHAEEQKEYFSAPIDADMWRVQLDVELRSSHVNELFRHDRELRGQARQGLLARVLIGLVALMVALAGFVRLDEWTKGFLTHWLSIGAIAFVTTVIAGVAWWR